MKDIISNCFLCGEHSLHVVGSEEAQVMQCINCGYTTTSKFNGTKETNDEFKKLSEEMKNWAVEANGKIWIPSIITLPIGMLYPINITVPNDKEDKVMKWSFSPMVEIPEEERKNFPNPQGGFYEKRVDTDNPVIYDEFINGMSYISELMKKSSVKKPPKIKLPKLKKK